MFKKKYTWIILSCVNFKFENFIWKIKLILIVNEWLVILKFFGNTGEPMKLGQQQGTTSHAEASGKCSTPWNKLFVYFYNFIRNFF